MPGDEILFRAAVAAFDTGDFPRAAAVAQYGLLAAPDAGRLWEVRGLALFAMNDFPAAATALERATGLTPLAPLAQVALADCYARLGKPDLARTILVFLAEPGRGPEPILPRVAAGLGRIGEYATALGVCERLTGVRPGYHPAWFGVAFYRQKLGYPAAELVDPLFAAVQLAPDKLTYRLNLATVCDDLGWYPMAYGVVREVPAERVLCPRVVAKLIRVFAHVGDAGRVAEYEAWLARMADSDPRAGCGGCEL